MMRVGFGAVKRRVEQPVEAKVSEVVELGRFPGSSRAGGGSVAALLESAA